MKGKNRLNRTSMGMNEYHQWLCFTNSTLGVITPREEFQINL